MSWDPEGSRDAGSAGTAVGLGLRGKLVLSLLPLVLAAFGVTWFVAKGAAIQVHELGLIALAMDNLRIRLKFKYTPDDVKNEALDLQALIGF